MTRSKIILQVLAAILTTGAILALKIARKTYQQNVYYFTTNGHCVTDMTCAAGTGNQSCALVTTFYTSGRCVTKAPTTHEVPF